jgi:hypothetical protein
MELRPEGEKKRPNLLASGVCEVGTDLTCRELADRTVWGGLPGPVSVNAVAPHG